MSSDDRSDQEAAEGLDEEKLRTDPEYGADDEAVDPSDRPMGAEEIHTDHPDPLTYEERERMRDWRPSDDESPAVRMVDDASAAEDDEGALVADEWKHTTDSSAEEQAVHERQRLEFRDIDAGATEGAMADADENEADVDDSVGGEAGR